MWNNNDHETAIFPPCRGFLTPPPASLNNPKTSYSSMTDYKRRSPANRGDYFHVIYKVPSGNSPYVRAKQVQLIEKDPSRAISLFWSAINAGDRVDSALKDMAIVMKQLDRSDEAIEAIKSFRHLCSNDSQESLDNVLVELYKRAGRIDEEIEMLQNKLKCIEEGTAFGGRRTKTARSQGKKVQITIEQEKARILGNLAWAYLQQNNYTTAAEYYRQALSLESDKNKQCNLAICLMLMNRKSEARSLLQAVSASSGKKPMDEAYAKSFERAHEMLAKLETESVVGGDGNCCKEISRSLSTPMVPRWSEEVRRKETYRLRDQNTETYCGSHFEGNANIKDSFTVHDDNKSSRFTSLRGESAEKYAQQAVSVNKLKNDYSEIKDEWRSRFASLKKNCTGGTSASEATSLQKKACFSPAPPRFSVRAPFTHPRRCLWGFGKGDQRRIEGRRKQVVGNSKKHPSDDVDWRRKNSTNDERNLSQNFTAESPIDGAPIDRAQPMMETPKQPTLDSSDYNKKKSWADMVEEEEEEELCGFYNPWNSEEAIFSEESLKSDIINESPCPLQTQMKTASQKYERVWREWRSEEEEFNDENMNSNIVDESPRLQTQMKNVTRKLEFCDLNNSSPGNSVWSRNQSVRRNLYFDRNQERGDSSAASSCSSSPVPRKDPNIDGLNSLQSKLRCSISGNDIKLMRRPHRLKVFQDITRQPETP